jgi:hypothetical protein
LLTVTTHPDVSDFWLLTPKQKQKALSNLGKNMENITDFEQQLRLAVEACKRRFPLSNEAILQVADMFKRQLNDH